MLGNDRLRMKLQTLHIMFHMMNAHNDIFIVQGIHRQNTGHGSRIHCPGMIQACFKLFGDTVEQIISFIDDPHFAGDAMTHGSHIIKHGAVNLSYTLMPKANAEYAFFRAVPGDQLHHNPRFRRDTRSG